MWQLLRHTENTFALADISLLESFVQIHADPMVEIAFAATQSHIHDSKASDAINENEGISVKSTMDAFAEHVGWGALSRLYGKKYKNLKSRQALRSFNTRCKVTIASHPGEPGSREQQKF